MDICGLWPKRRSLALVCTLNSLTVVATSLTNCRGATLYAADDLFEERDFLWLFNAFITS